MSVLQLHLGHVHLKPLRGVQSLAGRCLPAKAGRLLHARLAFELEQTAGIFGQGNCRARVERQGFPEQRQAGVLAGAVGHAADQWTDLVNHLRMKRGQRDACVGMAWRQPDGVLQRSLDLGAHTLARLLATLMPWL